MAGTNQQVIHSTPSVCHLYSCHFQMFGRAIHSLLHATMETTLHVVCMALMFCYICDASAVQSSISLVQEGGESSADHSGPFSSHNVILMKRTLSFLNLEFLDFLSDAPQPCHVAYCHYTVDRFHSQDTTTMQSIADCNPCVDWAAMMNTDVYITPQPLCILIYRTSTTASKIKFGHMPIRYYDNSYVTFNIILSGDVETNPGPFLLLKHHILQLQPTTPIKRQL